MQTTTISRFIEILGIWLPVGVLFFVLIDNTHKIKDVILGGFGTGSLLIPAMILLAASIGRVAIKSIPTALIVISSSAIGAAVILIWHAQLWEAAVQKRGPEFGTILFTMGAYVGIGIIASFVIGRGRTNDELTMCEND